MKRIPIQPTLLTIFIVFFVASCATSSNPVNPVNPVNPINPVNPVSPSNPVNQIEWPTNSLTPSGPVDFNDEDEDARWSITGPLYFPLDWVEDESFNAGFSMYVAAYPQQEVHAGPLSSGALPGTWMMTQRNQGGNHDFYSSIEGGTGSGAGNRFPSQGTKFTMGAVSADFTHWANGPGTGGGLEGEEVGVYWDEWSWEIPVGKYGIAQLSPHVLFPPDGLNMAADSNGGLLGYGYHPLPIIDARETSGPYGTVQTGNQSWTLFMSTANFQGPVAFIFPDFYTYPIVNVEEISKQYNESPYLDTIGSEQNRAVEVELWEIPAVKALDENGTPYVKTTRTQFPANGGDDHSSIILDNVSIYQRKALWDSTETWFAGGNAPTGELAADATFVNSFEILDFANDYLGWLILPQGIDGGEEGDPEYQIDWSSLVKVDVSDRDTMRYRWNLELVERTDHFFVIPEYYRLDNDPTAKFGKVWTPILEKDLPPETGLADHVFDELNQPQNNRDPYETPTNPESPWQSPGPASETFEVELGDGSYVEYAWYRFVDQPAMRHRDFTDAEREVIQKRVEMIHREWTPDRQYLAPPSVGELVSLNDAVLVTPPEGMEVGYVPIYIRQALIEP